MTENSRRKPGWHRKDLRLNPCLEDRTKTNPHLKNAEKSQLLAEVEMIRSYQVLSGKICHDKKGKKGQLVKRKTKYDCYSQT